MTIDETIKHCEDVARGHERNCEIFIDNVELYAINKEWADNYHNIAKWLREVKKWRALRDSINMLCDVDCEYPQYRESGTMCDACPVGTVKEYFELIFDEEVKADEE